ncbi:SDR family oxidoreductase [Aggregatilinea lenta]|uniref:SDR family oxidoreductase n=1 Tax=Aggregatilinea lenta TaxID=913108 RepID=UPI000E5B4D03|nr:SDR family oxidoreductase [Aggregatilinea lenta]
MSATHQPVLLVTGASGHMGRRVLELLLDAQAGPIIATTRTPDSLAEFSARGVTVRHGDFNNPDTLPAAFAGADRLLLISTDVVMEPGLRTRQHLTAVQAAQTAGVGHVIYTSLTNPGPDSLVSLAPDHHATEEALRASPMNWTLLRNNVYADPLPGALAQAIQIGSLYRASGDGRIGYVTREDCARAAAAVLADGFTGRRTLDVTGPDALSGADLAALATSISGKPVAYVPLPPDVLRENLRQAGLPDPVIEVIVTFDESAAAGQLDVVTSAVEELTGHAPTPVAAFLAQHKEVLLGTPQR